MGERLDTLKDMWIIWTVVGILTVIALGGWALLEYDMKECRELTRDRCEYEKCRYLAVDNENNRDKLLNCVAIEEALRK